MNTKICSKCNTEKDFKDFAKDNSRKDGLMYICKLCHKGKNKKYYQENKEKVMAYSEKYNKENKEKIRACKEKYRLANKDKLSKQKKTI
jgi:hypothetical protein